MQRWDARARAVGLEVRLRIATWNVNHRTVQRAIPASLAGAVLALDADVVVLTEWVPGPSRTTFVQEVAAGGLAHMLQSVVTPKQNHVLVLSRRPLEVGTLRGPDAHESMLPNVLHVRLRAEGVDVVGLRVPDYSKTPALRRVCWDWIERTAATLRDHPSVVIGDLNTDPAYPPGRCGDRFARVVGTGWFHALPPTGASYWTLLGDSKRLDHCFASRHWRRVTANYVTECGQHRYAGAPRSLSDHAALVVDIER